ncbi:MAG: diphosphokinase / guanosine-3,5-bis(diphosphate) 3-diphosphatase, partial [Solirubrobacteraceae bacterium]|nr:diphosphokinase / guanosine-3,5-bis(diphosphate) 3-diphosphatase [Solirubrobacteraceae bacterium]
MAERGDGKGGVRAPARQRAGARRAPVDELSAVRRPAVDRADLTELERSLLSDVFAIVEEHADASAVEIDRKQVESAFVFACEHHADQRRLSGEDFIHHPVGVAKICAGMRLDTETLCAALLHDTVEDTSASLTEVRHQFGEEIANIVDGVTKLTGIVFQSRDEAQAENYRKMMVAMANDVRVILIKLA